MVSFLCLRTTSHSSPLGSSLHVRELLGRAGQLALLRTGLAGTLPDHVLAVGSVFGLAHPHGDASGTAVAAHRAVPAVGPDRLRRRRLGHLHDQARQGHLADLTGSGGKRFPEPGRAGGEFTSDALPALTTVQKAGAENQPGGNHHRRDADCRPARRPQQGGCAKRASLPRPTGARTSARARPSRSLTRLVSTSLWSIRVPPALRP